MSKIFVDACFGKSTPYAPVWMMRQAGRYLPEYREVRAKVGSFLKLCHNPKLSAEVSLQPVDLVGVDACIMFSDILVVPNEMGMELSFEAGEGPKFANPIKTKQDIDNLLGLNDASDKLTYVYETIEILAKELQQRGGTTALIGFCGSPWTLATYMIEGKGSKTYSICKKMMYENPELLHYLLQKVSEVLKLYLEQQIKSGVDVVQIFDSWASAIEPACYDEFSWSYMADIAKYIKNKYPHIPIIMFPKGICAFLPQVYGDFDVFGVDWSTPLGMAKEILGDKYVLQGNMEPCRLYDKTSIEKCVNAQAKIMGNKRHIFNLGHGILPDVSVENAKYFVKLCKEAKA